MPLCQLNYFSAALNKATSATIILPDPSVPRPYHAMLLLHGLSDDHTIWARRTSIERYVEGLPLVVVMPDGGRSFYCDAVQGPAYGKAIGEELPNLIEGYLGVEPTWGIAGLSMGGYGAFRLALTYPQRFSAAVSHSGALTFGHYYGNDRADDFGREFALVLGDTPQNGPNDLFHLASTVDPLPALRFDCGTEDFLLPANRAFHAHLVEHDLPHEYEEFPGDHNWAYWDEHVQEAIAFLRTNQGF